MLIFGVNAQASPFECLRGLIPLTESGTYQKQRPGVERPFIVDDRYIVFPEVSERKVTGFFIYSEKGARYYDSIVVKDGKQSRRRSLISLFGEAGSYQMTAQPNGLETVTLYYQPRLVGLPKNSSGPIMLGASVLPVVGAFVSRPEQYDYVYQNPQRQPASVSEVRKLVTLTTELKPTAARLQEPFKEELRLREKYVGSNNLDNQTFMQVSRLLDGPCRKGP